MTENKFTIIVHTYPHHGRIKDLVRCLESLKNQSMQNFQILIVENSDSKKEVSEIIKNLVLLEKTKIITDSKRKLSYLFNLGWKHTNTEFIAYIADDAEANSRWLEQIQLELSLHKDVGACSGPIVSACFPAGEMHRLYLLSQKNLLVKILSWPYLHFALGDRVLDPGILLESGAYTLGASLEDSKKYPRQEIDLLTTSSMGIRRSAIKKINGFNEKYFFNHADGDLFIRLKESGYKLIFNPKIIVKHHMALGPSRNAYFIGKDTARFYKEHIHPRSFTGIIGLIMNILVLNLYWVLEAVRQKNTKPLVGIYSFVAESFNPLR